jgi:hypothetical protein
MNGEERQPAADGSQLASSENTQRQHSSREFRPAYSDEHVARSVRTVGIGNECPVAEEVYRQLDYLTADQALDWMSRISGFQVPIHTLLAMAEFELCSAYLDCRTMKGLTHAAVGEHEHREVYGLGICQVMNPLPYDKGPVYLTGPSIHIDREGYQEIEPKRSWWVDDLATYEMLFRPSEIEQLGGMVTENGGWSNAKQNADLEANPHMEIAPEHSGSELAQLLGKLQISIDNQHDRLRYCVRFEDGRLLAELGSNLTPIAPIVYANSVKQMEGATGGSHDNEVSRANDIEITRLRELVAKQSHLLEAQSSVDTSTSAPDTRVIFPYATKALLAMRDAAEKHWVACTYQPTQISVQMTLCKTLGIKVTDGNEAPRKSKELAAAIKPDNLPDA